MEGDHAHQAQAQKSTSLLPIRAPESSCGASVTQAYPTQWFQQMVGNRTASLVIQAKLRLGSAGDRYEQEADRVADRVMRGETLSDRRPGPLEASGSQRIQRMCSECAEEGRRPDEDDELEKPQLKARGGSAPAIAQVIQRKEADGPEPQSPEPAPAEVSSRPLIVDDETGQLEPGQMKKSEFLSRLRESVCGEAEQVMAGTGQTTEGCPYIERWFGYYQDKDSRYIERSLHKYAPEAAGVTSANDYVPIVASRVRRSVEAWARTGEITGVPEDLAAQVMGGGALAAIGGVISGIGSAVAGVVSGIGSAISKIGGFLFKAKDGGAQPRAGPGPDRLGLEGGRSLDTSVRNTMEPAFGYDFSQVRIHTESAAADASLQMNARAFTMGSQIAFAPGEYQPGTVIGDALIAHELAHVVQQGGALSSGALQKADAPGEGPSESLEEDADIAAVSAVAGIWGGPAWGLGRAPQNAMPALKSGLRLQRCHHQNKPPAVAAPAGLPPANVAAGACAASFAGVTFSLSNKQAKSSTNAAEAVILPSPRGPAGVLRGIPGKAHAEYTPSITIHAPDDATAGNFEAGVIQNILASDRRFVYSDNGLIKAVLPSLPMKDGAPKKSGLYDEVFLENGQAGPRLLEGFTASDTSVSLELRDSPIDGAAVTLSNDPSCPAGTASDTLQQMILRDKFRTWVGVRHKPSGCVVTQHHIEWETNWEGSVSSAAVGAPVATLVQGSSDVTLTDGDGSPQFVKGGPVPSDLKNIKDCKG